MRPRDAIRMAWLPGPSHDDVVFGIPRRGMLISRLSDYPRKVHASTSSNKQRSAHILFATGGLFLCVSANDITSPLQLVIGGHVGELSTAGARSLPGSASPRHAPSDLSHLLDGPAGGGAPERGVLGKHHDP
ncbi:hypothetical protein PCL_12364 [Purpureocillium lilacinum]|uniref:Uncharacterized protein n=1 Tax=Purpureocillium lilacinum TaxID=33203 RepID=A0A2U3E911_PURLI|nr:hypothetical protein PCL_12364 [Purpureocillium lilacinum]